MPELVKMIVNSLGTIQNHEYMEFVQDFLSTYTHLMDQEVGVIAQAII